MSPARSADGRATVLHVTNIPTPYRLPQYRAFAHELAKSDIDLVVYFIGAGKRPRYWDIPESDFAGLSPVYGRPGASIPARALGITRTIDRLQPAVVVLAWAMDPTALLVLWHCRARSIPCIIYTGETDDAAAQRSFACVRDAVRRMFLKSADGFVVYGTSAKRYLTNRGVDASRIWIAINVVDTEFFRRSVEELHATGAANVLSGDGMKLLCVGELIELKALPLLLDALAACRHRDVALHLVGSGPQEAELRERCERLGLTSRVTFHGYQQKADLPRYYASADALVFSSMKDVFGLVMVEGAAAGLPVIGSSMSGGTVDVVIPGETGFIVDPRDTSSFAEAIDTLASDAALRGRMGAASKAHAMSRLTPEVSAHGYAEAITSVLGRRS